MKSSAGLVSNSMRMALGPSAMQHLSNGSLSAAAEQPQENFSLANLSDLSSQQQPAGAVGNNAEGEEQETPQELDIVINNVVCSFSVCCHLNLRHIALQGFNVEYRRENGMVTMKLRRPHITASIWSSGKVTCTGATSEEEAKVAARRVARCLQKMKYDVKFCNFRIVNVLGTCSMPFSIKIDTFTAANMGPASYEPELHPGVTYKLLDPKATLKIFSTGSVTVTAPRVEAVQKAIEHIFPLVHQFRSSDKLEHLMKMDGSTDKGARRQRWRKYRQTVQNNWKAVDAGKVNPCPSSSRSRTNPLEVDDEDDEFVIDSTEEEEFDSDKSWD